MFYFTVFLYKFNENSEIQYVVSHRVATNSTYICSNNGNLFFSYNKNRLLKHTIESASDNSTEQYVQDEVLVDWKNEQKEISSTELANTGEQLILCVKNTEEENRKLFVEVFDFKHWKRIAKFDLEDVKGLILDCDVKINLDKSGKYLYLSASTAKKLNSKKLWIYIYKIK